MNFEFYLLTVIKRSDMSCFGFLTFENSTNHRSLLWIQKDYLNRWTIDLFWFCILHN